MSLRDDWVGPLPHECSGFGEWLQRLDNGVSLILVHDVDRTVAVRVPSELCQDTNLSQPAVEVIVPFMGVGLILNGYPNGSVPALGLDSVRAISVGEPDDVTQ